jgi:hypothetical protein
MFHSGIQINIIALRTFLLSTLKLLVLPQDDADLENYFGHHCTDEFQGLDNLAIFGVYHLIVTPPHVMISVVIFAEAFDNVIKTLVAKICDLKN